MIDFVAILKLLWVPILGIGGWFFRGLHEKYQSLNDRFIRLEATAITRESLESILDKKLDKLYDAIQKVNQDRNDSLKDIKEELKDIRDRLGR